MNRSLLFYKANWGLYFDFHYDFIIFCDLDNENMRFSVRNCELCGGGMEKSKGENQESGNWKLRNACNQKLQVGHRPGSININSPICKGYS